MTGLIRTISSWDILKIVECPDSTPIVFYEGISMLSLPTVLSAKTLLNPAKMAVGLLHMTDFDERTENNPSDQNYCGKSFDRYSHSTVDMSMASSISIIGMSSRIG